MNGFTKQMFISGVLNMDGFGLFDDMNGVPGFEGSQGGFFSGFSSFEMLNAWIPILFGVVFVGIAGIIAYVIISNLRTWSANNATTLLTLHSTIVTKRTQVRGGGNSRASTYYYVTFELDNGERIELMVGGSEYGALVERDQGMLTYQGTRFKHFERDLQQQSGISTGRFYT